MSQKPKHPMSAFLLWLNSHRSEIKAQYPGLNITEIAKKGGEIWRSMSDKSKWEEEAQQLREKYSKDLKDYNEQCGGGERATRKRRRLKQRSPSSSSCSCDD